ncbi:MAG: hypothetical protein ACON4T_01485 [Synechococcus sp.]
MTRFKRSSIAGAILGFLTPLSFGAADPIAAQAGAGHNHGGGSEADLKSGEFRSTPVITLEGHGGFENNLTSEGKPAHYAIDGLFGGVMEWGLPNQGSFAIEAAIGPALVWGEAEHFYGRVHLEDEEHGEHSDEEHGHGEGQPFRRIDMKGMLQARYQPNDRLTLAATWLPYAVTRSQGEDIQGVKHEINAGVTYAFGDGDVNFALGDGWDSVVDGLFVSVSNHTGWESDGVYVGNYTDTWAGFGFNYDQLSITLTGGPRFYSPGSSSGLSQRTDWGGEIALEYPISDSVVAFAHWEAIYSTASGEGWGKGFQNHLGTGLSFRF